MLRKITSIALPLTGFASSLAERLALAELSLALEERSSESSDSAASFRTCTSIRQRIEEQTRQADLSAEQIPNKPKKFRDEEEFMSWLRKDTSPDYEPTTILCDEPTTILQDIQKALDKVEKKHHKSKGLFKPKIHKDVRVVEKIYQTMKDNSELVQKVYDDAKKWAIATSYGCNPKKKFDPEGTAAAIWKSIIRNWDQDKTIIFAYNRNNFSVGTLMGKTKVEILTDNIDTENGWNMSVVEKLSDQIHDHIENPQDRQAGQLYWPKGNVEGLCGNSTVIFVELGTEGMTGAWHTKFLLNDRGHMGTTGWSLGNKSKPLWMDAGILTHTSTMAEQEKRFFIERMLPYAKSIGRAVFVEKEDGKKGFEFRSYESEDVKEARKHLIRKLNEEAGPEAEAAPSGEEAGPAEAPSGVCDYHALDVRHDGYLPGKYECMMIRNMGTPGYIPSGRHELRPIGTAMECCFARLKEGDTVWLRQGSAVNYASDRWTDRTVMWIVNALFKGAYVRILWLHKQDTEGPKNIKQLYKDIREKLSTLVKNKHTNQDERDAKMENFNKFGIKKIVEENHRSKLLERDHAKVYSFEYKTLEICKDGDWVEYRPGDYETPIQDVRTQIANGERDTKVFRLIAGQTAFGIGTWNLDYQSFYGSFENLMMFSDKEGTLTEKFVKVYWKDGMSINKSTGEVIEKVREPLERR